MKPQSQVRASWYATRTIPMPDHDERGIESILIWIEHREDGSWAVGRASDLTQRTNSQPRESDYLFSGFEIDDALDSANGALEDDLVASERDGIRDVEVAPFLRRDLEDPLNEWFWGRRPT